MWFVVVGGEGLTEVWGIEGKSTRGESRSGVTNALG